MAEYPAASRRCYSGNRMRFKKLFRIAGNRVSVVIRTLLLAQLAVFAAACLADEDHSWDAHYIANAGVMVTRGEAKILFDPFFRNGYGVYDLAPQQIEAAIFAGNPPWDSVDAIFVSHHHGDHFDPMLILEYLKVWTTVHLYAPQQAIDALLSLDIVLGEALLDRIHGIELERDSAAARLELNGLEIEAVRIAHGGWPDRNSQVENLVFRVTLDNATTVMHLGDADGGKEHYAPHAAFWKERNADLALVPVWLFLTEKGQYVLKNHVDAQLAIGIHVYKSIPDDPNRRPPEFDGLDIFTKPGESRSDRQ